jgi:hypothetical protein
MKTRKRLRVRVKRSIFVLAFALVLVAGMTLAGGCGAKKPVIDSLDPQQGPVGTQVVINGSGFGKTQGEGTVTFGDKGADVVAWTDTKVTVKVPLELAAAPQGVTVLTEQGESNQVDFTVEEGAPPAPDRKEGEVESNTPAQTMLDYMKKNNIDTGGWIFSVVQVSEKDPDWKIDKASKSGQQSMYFLLYKDNGVWVVKDEGSALNRDEIKAKGAPSDLYEKPAPETQAQAFLDYLKARGIDPAGYSMTIWRDSIIDSNWEIGLVKKAGSPDQQLVLHKENGNWVAKGMGAYTYDELVAMGVPKDIAHPETEAQVIGAFIQQKEQGTDTSAWNLSVTKISKVDPDWEIVTGTNAQAGTMYFLLHWENGTWVVKSYGGDPIKPNSVPGQPSDLP